MSLKFEVHKFGGDATETDDRVRRNAEQLRDLTTDGNKRIIAVVSAARGHTDDLLRRVKMVHPGINLGNKAADMVVSTGEQQIAGITSLALTALGIQNEVLFPNETTLQARQVGREGNQAFVTTADGQLLRRKLEEVPVIVVPGFTANVSGGGWRTTGRGGSEVTAVAIAVGLKQALKGEAPTVFCHKKEPGVRAVDPVLVQDAKILRHITHARAIPFIQASRKEFFAHRAARIAAANGIPIRFIQARSLIDPSVPIDDEGTLISTQTDGDIEPEEVFCALPARTFIRYDLAQEDREKVLRMLTEKGVQFEDFKENSEGGYKLLLPEIDSAEEEKRNDILNKNSFLKNKRKVAVFHFMNAQINSAEENFTDRIDRTLEKTGKPYCIGTETETITIECIPEDMKEFARVLADEFNLREAA